MPKTSLEISVISIRINKADKKPLYHQLYESIIGAIEEGKLRAGERLPATRQLSSVLKISRNIVSLAYEQLIIEGYLQGKIGAGTFVSHDLPDKYLKSAFRERIDLKSESITKNLDIKKTKEILPRNTLKEEVIPFQNAVPALDAFPFNIFNKIAINAYKEIKTFQLSYDEAAGFLPLRKTIATYLRSSRGVNCEEDQIIVVSGTQQALNICAQVFLKKGDEVLIEDPGYGGAKSAFSLSEPILCPVPVEYDGINVSYAKSQYLKPKLIYITPAHQYPFGGTLSMQKRRDLLDWAVEKQMWIIEDDYDSELKYNEIPLPSLQGMDQWGRVIYIGSFSKVLFPGLRLGYMVLPDKEMTKHFVTIKAALDRQSPIMEQVIVQRFIEEGHFSRHLRKMRLLYLERQNILIKGIQKDLEGLIRTKEQQAGMHLLGWLPEHLNDKIVSHLLSKHGIIANPLSDYVLKFKQPPGLLLGYTAFNKFKIRHFTQKMGEVLKKHLNQIEQKV